MVVFELVLLLLLCSVALGWVARRLKFPYPIALVAGGTAVGFIPNLPQFPFDPNAILILVLPPILYQAALLTSWSDFKANIRPISMKIKLFSMNTRTFHIERAMMRISGETISGA